MKYLRIGDFSNVIGISVKTIRFYEEIGLIEPSFVDKYTGYRYYDEKNIEQALIILSYKNMGFSLGEIRNINQDLLVSKVSSLKEQMINIKKNISHIESIIDKGVCNDMMFINDDYVIGKWELLDGEDFPFSEIYFLPEGKEYWVFSWTKGYLKIKDTYHPYKIIDDLLILSVVDINGIIDKEVKFKRIDNKKYTIDDIRVVDDLSYEFVNDDKVLGIWKTISFTNNNICEAINKKDDNLFLQRLIFCKDGKLIKENKNFINNKLLWTKGKVIDKYNMTSSKYEIVNIDNVSYLVFEWKSGDYIFGKTNNDKYILTKE